MNESAPLAGGLSNNCPLRKVLEFQKAQKQDQQSRKSLYLMAPQIARAGSGGEEAALKLGPQSSKASKVNKVFIYGRCT